MRKHLLITFLGALACYSCSNSYELLENDLELAKASSDYELSTRSIAEEATDSIKIETIADEQAIQAVMDEYVVQLMNNPSIAKEKVMRTLYSTTCDVVGVFKVGSCGVYKELELNIDAEDTRQDSRKEGSIGDSYVDGNGNIRFKFCLTEASQYYPGGVFLLDHIDYAPYYGGEKATMQVMVRYHDCDDKRPDNKVVSCGDYRYNQIEKLSNGFTQIGKNAALAWAFPSQFKVPFVCSSYFGPKSMINYGVLSGSINAISGKIYVDDEDTDNKNWAKVYQNLVLKSDLPRGDYPEYGITIRDNTFYNITLSTDVTRFVSLNNYYPAKVSDTCN